MTTPSRHLFVIDPLENLNLAWDTTIKLAFTMSRLGCEVFAVESTGLMLKSHPQTVLAEARPMRFTGAPETIRLGESLCKELAYFSAVHMRKEPPFDLAYIEALWLLQYARAVTKVWNDPLALLQLNEKLVITEFAEYSKPAFIASNHMLLAQFAEEHAASDVVVKPLNLYGGRGVVHLSQKESLENDLERETMQGTATRLVQKFEPNVTKGEVRAFTVAGLPMSWCLKIPHSGDFLANTRAGSTLHAYKPTADEVNMVTKVAKNLFGRGVMVAGFDVINGGLSEVNITCPAVLSPERASLAGFEEMAQTLLEHL